MFLWSAIASHDVMPGVTEEKPKIPDVRFIGTMADGPGVCILRAHRGGTLGRIGGMRIAYLWQC